MDRFPILGAGLLVAGIVGTLGLVEARGRIARLLVVLATVLIAWRIIAGRRPS
jgi:hypothetical protein